MNPRQTLLRRSPSFTSTCGGGGGGSTAAEFCGGATASCAALWCCGPCSVVNLVVLAVYKVPRGICRRTIRRMRRRRLAKGGLLPPSSSSGNGECEKMKMVRVGSSQFAIHPLESKDEGEFDKTTTDLDSPEEEEEEEDDEAVIALEKEMWNRFYSGGFWRSHSQIETVSSLSSD